MGGIPRKLYGFLGGGDSGTWDCFVRGITVLSVLSLLLLLLLLLLLQQLVRLRACSVSESEAESHHHPRMLVDVRGNERKTECEGEGGWK